MQWLASLCVRRPVFASVIILALTVVGSFSFFQLGLDRFPKVDFPTIIVTTRQPGASPEQIESEITDKLEESINTISGIDDLRSTSAEGVSQVMVAFVLEKNVDVAAQEVRDKVNRVLPELPDTIDQPTVEKFDPDAAPVLTLAVSSDKPVREITEFADKNLRRRLESINGVGQVLVLGGRERQVNIVLDGARLQAYNLTVTDVSRALQRQNAEIPGGRIEEGPRTLTLRTLGRVPSIEIFNDIVVRERDGHPVLLRDVARVDDGMAEATSLANVNGASTVMLQVRRQSGTNTVAVVEAVKERLEEIKPTLPKGMDVRVVRDMSEFIEASIHSVEEHLVIGSILAALVVLLFLWNMRSTFIAAIAIPTSIVSTFGVMWYMGFTLNSMTMLALTLAVGIVIDDAIVVLENIYRFIEEKGQSPFEAAINATQEIGLAVLATTLSLVAIFVPVAFMGGIVGRFMTSFGLTMSAAILVSMLVSFTLTPMMSARWLKRAKKSDAGVADADVPEMAALAAHGAQAGHGGGSKESRVFGAMDRGYASLISWSLRHRAVIAGVTVLVFLSTVPLFMTVSKAFLPQDDQSEFEISLRTPEGMSLENTELMATRIATRVRQLAPETTYTLVTAGSDAAQTPNTGSIYVRLKPIDARERDQFAIMNEVRERLAKDYAHENLRLAVQPVATFGGGGNQNADIQFLISGPELDKLAALGTSVAAEVRKLPGVVDVDTSLNVGKPEVSVSVDRLKAADLGVEISEAAEALRLLVGGDQVSTYNEGGEQYEVHLRAEAGDRSTKDAIGSLTVPSSRLGVVSLDNVALFADSQAPSEVLRLGRQRQVTVFANVLPGASQSPAIAAIQEKFMQLNTDPAYAGRFVGRSRELGRAAQNFVLAFVLSLVFMYLILAAQFESWLHPVTILLSLPLTLPFALIALDRHGAVAQHLLGARPAGAVRRGEEELDSADRSRDPAARARARQGRGDSAGEPRSSPPDSDDDAGVRGGHDSAGRLRRHRRRHQPRDRLRHHRRPVAGAAADAGGHAGGVFAVRLGVEPAAVLAAVGADRARHAGPTRRGDDDGGRGDAGGGAERIDRRGADARGADAAATTQGAGRTVTVEQAVEMALANNPDLAIVRIEPELGAARSAQARSAFTPYLTGSRGPHQYAVAADQLSRRQRRRRDVGLVFERRRASADAVRRRHLEHLVGQLAHDQRQHLQQLQPDGRGRPAGGVFAAAAEGPDHRRGAPAGDCREAQSVDLRPQLQAGGGADGRGGEACVLGSRGVQLQRDRAAAVARSRDGAGASEQGEG